MFFGLAIDYDNHLEQIAHTRSSMRTYVGPNHATSLHAHVIQRRGHGPRPHRTSIPTRDRHENRVHVRRSDEKRAQGPFHPRSRILRNRLQGDQYGQRPDLAHESGQEALVRLLGHPGPEEQPGDEEHVGGDGEQVGCEGAEAGGFELQGQVLRHRVVGDEPGEAEEVDGPHVVVCQAVPEGFG